MKRSSTRMPDTESSHLRFADNKLLPALFGAHDRNLAKIEQALGVTLSSRGNEVAISGPEEEAQAAEAVLRSLYDRLARGQSVGSGEVEAALRLARDGGSATRSSSGLDQVSVIETRPRLDRRLETIDPRQQRIDKPP